MNKIKFSEDYKKLPLNWKGTQARLITVRCISLDYFKTVFPQFIKYDTEYRGKEGNYDLYFDDDKTYSYYSNSSVRILQDKVIRIIELKEKGEALVTKAE